MSRRLQSLAGSCLLHPLFGRTLSSQSVLQSSLALHRCTEESNTGVLCWLRNPLDDVHQSCGHHPDKASSSVAADALLHFLACLSAALPSLTTENAAAERHRNNKHHTITRTESSNDGLLNEHGRPGPLWSPQTKLSGWYRTVVVGSPP